MPRKKAAAATEPSRAPSASDPAVMFRVPDEEKAAIEAARLASGLPGYSWYRLMVRAGAGQGDLMAALKRAQSAGAKEEP